MFSISSLGKVSWRLVTKGSSRLTLLILLILCCISITYYSHFILRTEVVFSHFFYVPIVWAAFWWGRRAVWVAVFLGGWLMASDALSPSVHVLEISNLLRSGMFVVIALTIGALREHALRLGTVEELAATLEKEKTYTKSIISNMSDLLVVFDKAGRIETVNEQAEKRLKYSRDELLGKQIGHLFAEEEEEEELQLFNIRRLNQLLKGGSTKGVDVKIRTKEGEILPVLVSVGSIRDDGGEVIHYVVTANDITDLKRAQEGLQESARYARALFEASLDPLVTISPEGKITDVNSAWEEATGLPRDKMVGTEFSHYFTEPDAARKGYQQVFRDDYVRDYPLEIKNREGKTTPVLYNASVYHDVQENVAGVFAAARDITDLKRAEEERRKLEMQLIHAGRLSTLGEMATGMAHEINQPLSIISMAAEGLSRDIKKNRLDLDILPQDLEEILDYVKRIDRIITHMRTFARQREECEQVKPEQPLNNAFAIFSEQFRMHSISISSKIEENLPLIEVDPNQLEQVFINILTNARQVLDERGEESKRERKGFQKQLICSIAKEDDYVVFEFADNAYGVPDENKMRVFEPFFTTKEVGQGTGLGLSIAYNIVTRISGGKIWVEDNEMGGASFKIALPVKDRE
ncbi:MAG: PAS domain S-box protein [Desulfobacterales bacterium]|nr:PAS domain S-box protein [Desulfobacterales bacterium]